MSMWNDRNWTPMLLGQVNKPFDSKEYLYELKFDGIRAVIFVSPRSIAIYNRHGAEITHLFPELEKVKEIVKDNTIFDGEIIALENGFPSFSKLQQRVSLKNIIRIRSQAEKNPILFICFDILFRGKDLINLPLQKRKNLLNKYPDTDYFIKSKYIEKEGKKLFTSVVNLKLEGIVAKKKNSLYEINSRSDNWLKIKNIQENYFYIGGYIDKKASYTISLFLGEKENQNLIFVGKVTLGKKHNLYKKILKQKINKKSSFINFEEEGVCYISPKLKCKVRYLEKTSNNHLRHPVIVLESKNS